MNTMKDCAANRVEAIDDEILIKESGKLRFLVQLMSQLKQEGHRTLIFSMSRKMLNIIQKVIVVMVLSYSCISTVVNEISLDNVCKWCFDELLAVNLSKENAQYHTKGITGDGCNHHYAFECKSRLIDASGKGMLNCSLRHSFNTRQWSNMRVCFIAVQKEEPFSELMY